MKTLRQRWALAGTVLFICGCTAAPDGTPAAEYDLLLTGGTVIDGTG